MKTFLPSLLLALPALAQIDNLGTLEASNRLVWDDPNTNRADMAGFRLTIATTSNVPIVVLSVATNEIRGSVAMTNLSGWKHVWLTAVTTNEVESNPSATSRVMFRNGVPLSPTNLSILQIVTAMATNQLPVVR